MEERPPAYGRQPLSFGIEAAPAGQPRALGAFRRGPRLDSRTGKRACLSHRVDRRAASRAGPQPRAREHRRRVPVRRPAADRPHRGCGALSTARGGHRPTAAGPLRLAGAKAPRGPRKLRRLGSHPRRRALVSCPPTLWLIPAATRYRGCGYEVHRNPQTAARRVVGLRVDAPAMPARPALVRAPLRPRDQAASDSLAHPGPAACHPRPHGFGFARRRNGRARSAGKSRIHYRKRDQWPRLPRCARTVS